MNRKRLAVCLLSWLLLGLAPAGPALAEFEQMTQLYLSPMLGNLKWQIATRATRAPEERVLTQGQKLGFNSFQAQAMGPLWNGRENELSLRISAAYWSFSGNAILPDTGEKFPSDFKELKLTMAYRRAFSGGDVAGLVLGYGSPSDEPFHSMDETDISATLFYRLARTKDSAWLFYLNYDKNRDLLEGSPLPAAAYWQRESDNLQWMLGLPSMLSARLARRWRVNLFYFVPRSVYARLGYQLFRGVEAYGSFSWQKSHWYRVNRANGDDKLTFYRKEAKLGTVFLLSRGLKLDLSGGFSFDREIFEGKDYDDRNHNRLELSDAWIVSLSLSRSF